MEKFFKLILVLISLLSAYAPNEIKPEQDSLDWARGTQPATWQEFENFLKTRLEGETCNLRWKWAGMCYRDLSRNSFDNFDDWLLNISMICFYLDQAFRIEKANNSNYKHFYQTQGHKYFLFCSSLIRAGYQYYSSINSANSSIQMFVAQLSTQNQELIDFQLGKERKKCFWFKDSVGDFFFIPYNSLPVCRPIYGAFESEKYFGLWNGKLVEVAGYIFTKTHKDKGDKYNIILYGGLDCDYEFIIDEHLTSWANVDQKFQVFASSEWSMHFVPLTYVQNDMSCMQELIHLFRKKRFLIFTLLLNLSKLHQVCNKLSDQKVIEAKNTTAMQSVELIKSPATTMFNLLKIAIEFIKELFQLMKSFFEFCINPKFDSKYIDDGQGFIHLQKPSYCDDSSFEKAELINSIYHILGGQGKFVSLTDNSTQYNRLRQKNSSSKKDDDHKVHAAKRQLESVTNEARDYHQKRTAENKIQRDQFSAEHHTQKAQAQNESNACASNQLTSYNTKRIDLVDQSVNSSKKKERKQNDTDNNDFHSVTVEEIYTALPAFSGSQEVGENDRKLDLELFLKDVTAHLKEQGVEGENGVKKLYDQIKQNAQALGLEVFLVGSCPNSKAKNSLHGGSHHSYYFFNPVTKKKSQPFTQVFLHGGKELYVKQVVALAEECALKMLQVL